LLVVAFRVMQIMNSLRIPNIFLNICLVACVNRENPLISVLEMLKHTKDCLKTDDKNANAIFRQAFMWCDVSTSQHGKAIKSHQRRVSKLKANIEKYSSEIETSREQVEETAGAIAASNSDIKDAEALREKQRADFETAANELEDTRSTLSRAMAIIEREVQDNHLTLIQVKRSNASAVLDAVNAVIDAAAFSSADKQGLLALVQSTAAPDQPDLSDPAPLPHKIDTANILDVLQDMKDKAENDLDELQKNEHSTQIQFQSLRLSLQNQIAENERLKSQETGDLAESKGMRAEAKKELAKAQGLLESESQALKSLRAQCIQHASNHEAASKSRAQELMVVSQAIAVLQSTTDAAQKETYSFVQVNSAGTLRRGAHLDPDSFEVVKLVKQMAKVHHSASLAQLSSRIRQVVKYTAESDKDMFAKIKRFIQDLITKLQREMRTDATEKTYCDGQLTQTSEKLSQLEDDSQKLSSVIDQESATSAEAKEAVKQLEARKYEVEVEQNKITAIRQKDKAAFEKTKANLQAGLDGVRKGAVVLQNYIQSQQVDGHEDSRNDDEIISNIQIHHVDGHDDSRKDDETMVDGSHHNHDNDTSHIGIAYVVRILEMIESDFATTLAKQETEESDAQNAYEKVTKDNELEIAMLEQDIKFKVVLYKGRDLMLVLHSSDHDRVAATQAAISQYDEILKQRCTTPAHTYEERKQRRDAEITGLREALELLKNDAAYMQQQQHRRGRRLRNGHLAA